MYYQQQPKVPIPAQSNISFVQPSMPYQLNVVDQSGLIGGQLFNSVSNAPIPQMQMHSMIPNNSQVLTLSKFPMAASTFNNDVNSSNMLQSQTIGVRRMDPEAATQLQAPGQPFIGAQPRPETKVLLETMDHYDVHYPESQCTIMPKKLYNRFFR